MLKAIEIGFELLKQVLPDPKQRAEATQRMMELEQSGELKRLDAAVQIIVAEAKSEHPLTSQWRPITMLVLVGCIASHWFGFTAPNLSTEEVTGLLDIVKFGLGGYVIGRSAEKTAKAWKST